MDEYEFEQFRRPFGTHLTDYLNELGKSGWHNPTMHHGDFFIMQRKVRRLPGEPDNNSTPSLLTGDENRVQQ